MELEILSPDGISFSNQPQTIPDPVTPHDVLREVAISRGISAHFGHFTLLGKLIERYASLMVSKQSIANLLVEYKMTEAVQRVAKYIQGDIPSEWAPAVDGYSRAFEQSCYMSIEEMGYSQNIVHLGAKYFAVKVTTSSPAKDGEYIRIARLDQDFVYKWDMSSGKTNRIKVKHISDVEEKLKKTKEVEQLEGEVEDIAKMIAKVIDNQYHLPLDYCKGVEPEPESVEDKPVVEEEVEMILPSARDVSDSLELNSIPRALTSSIVDGDLMTTRVPLDIEKFEIGITKHAKERWIERVVGCVSPQKRKQYFVHNEQDIITHMTEAVRKTTICVESILTEASFLIDPMDLLVFIAQVNRTTSKLTITSMYPISFGFTSADMHRGILNEQLDRLEAVENEYLWAKVATDQNVNFLNASVLEKNLRISNLNSEKEQLEAEVKRIEAEIEFKTSQLQVLEDKHLAEFSILFKRMEE